MVLVQHCLEDFKYVACVLHGEAPPAEHLVNLKMCFINQGLSSVA